MEYRHILFEVTDGVAKITLNRPDVLNSFNRAMAHEVQDALNHLQKDRQIRSALLTGCGRAFCAGQDLSEVVDKDGTPTCDIGDIVRESYNPIIRSIRHTEKPFVCAVNGVAAGAGANVALACDIVIAAKEASFIQAFSKIGLIPDSAGTFLLPRLVGLAQASALAMLGEKISAERAWELGMIYKVCQGAALIEETTALAKTLAALPTRGLGLIKRALNQSVVNDLDTQLKLEEELQREAGKTSDYREGVTAFMSKRAPKFQGM